MRKISYILVCVISLQLTIGVGSYAQQGGQEKTASPKIGCLFPLSGQKESFGLEALFGALLAVDSFEATSTEQKIKLLIEDTAGDAQLTKHKVKRLVERGATSIFGALTESEARAAAEISQKLEVPIILMNRGAALTSIGEYVFHNFTDPDFEVKRLLEYAKTNAQINCFGCLAPNNSYGNEYAKAFKSQLEAWKTSCRLYPNDSVDFREQILSLKSDVTNSTNCAVFIPDFPKRLKILLPQLFFWEFERVTLLGTEGWCNKELYEQTARYVKNALFLCPFWLDDPRAEVQTFVNKFEKTFGHKPTLLAAFAYDNAKILASCASKNPAPQAIRDCLISTPKFRGTCGLVSFSPTRKSVRNLQIFKFDGMGNIIIVQ